AGPATGRGVGAGRRGWASGLGVGSGRRGWASELGVGSGRRSWAMPSTMALDGRGTVPARRPSADRLARAARGLGARWLAGRGGRRRTRGRLRERPAQPPRVVLQRRPLHARLHGGAVTLHGDPRGL